MSDQQTTESLSQKILVVEDDELLQEVLTQSLKKKGFQVESAGNGTLAQEMLEEATYDLVILDLKLPEVSGIELLRQIKKKFSVPVILMTGFSSADQTKDAFLLGASGFLSKPFKVNELIDLIKTILPEVVQNRKPELKTDEAYRRVSIDDFKTSGLVKYDTYLRLSEHNYVKIIGKGKEIPLDKISFLKNKSILYLFLEKDDFYQHIFAKVFHSKIAPEAGEIKQDQKEELLYCTRKVLTERLFVNEFDPNLYESAKFIVESMMSLICSNQAMYTLVRQLKDRSQVLFEHSVCVSFLAAMLTLHLKWESSQTVYKIAVAGLLHDIGFIDLDPTMAGKTSLELDSKELELMQSHIAKGVDLLSKLKFIPDDFIQVVQQHHENCIGTGFPNGLSKSRIHPIARLISVCDAFCDLIARDENQFSMSAKDAVTQLNRICYDTLDYAFLTSLGEVVGIDKK